MRQFLVYLLLVGLQISLFAAEKPKPSTSIDSDVCKRLRVNYAENSIAIDDTAPRFSWELNFTARNQKQTAYQLIVTTDTNNFSKNSVWDTKKVKSAIQNGIEYSGIELKPKTEYWWKVKVWDANNIESEWSKPAKFETGTFGRVENWGKAYEIGGNYKLIRKEFELPKGKIISRARAYFNCKNEYGQLRINGNKIDNTVLTSQGPVGGYFVFDITTLLKSASNNVVGFVGATPSNLFTCNITVWFTDGSQFEVCSDSTFKGFNGGPYISSSKFHGDIYDARKEINGWDKIGFNDSEWVMQKEGIQGISNKAKLTVVKISDYITPVKITNPIPGKYIFDMGVNISGWVQLKVKGKAGDTVVLRFAERIKNDGTLNATSNSAGKVLLAEQTDTYILKGGETEIWQPIGTYHGFKYVEVSGFSETPDLESITGVRVHADFDNKRASFRSSDTLLNKIFKAFVDGQLDNCLDLHTDCNQRAERGAWTADAFCVTAPSMMYFDGNRFWERWITASNNNWGPQGQGATILSSKAIDAEAGRLLWPSHTVFIPWDYYTIYGDKTYLKPGFERAKKYANCLINLFDKLDEDVVYNTKTNKFISYKSKDDYLISSVASWKNEEGKRYDNPMGPHGDWLTPDPLGWKNAIDNVFLTSAFYFKCLNLTAKMAQELGNKKDETYYNEIAQKIRSAINNKFFINNSYYCNNEQGSNAIALDFGIVPENYRNAVAQNLIADIQKRNNHLNTGAISTISLMNALVKNNANETAFALATQTTYPSWGYMLTVPDATGTFWEKWNDDNFSKNHPFLGGSVAYWLFQSVVGIEPIAPGFSEIQLKPELYSKLDSAYGAVCSIKGKITSEWEKKNGEFFWNISIPANTTAKVYIPSLGRKNAVIISEGSAIIWDNKPQAKINGISYLKTEDNYTVWDLGSGFYQIKVK